MIFVCMPRNHIVSILLRQHQIISVVQAIQILVLPSVGLTLSLVCHYIVGTDKSKIRLIQFLGKKILVRKQF